MSMASMLHMTPKNTIITGTVFPAADKPQERTINLTPV